MILSPINTTGTLAPIEPPMIFKLPAIVTSPVIRPPTLAFSALFARMNAELECEYAAFSLS